VIALGLFLVAYGGWQLFRWGGVANKEAIGDAAFWPVNLGAVLLTGRIARRKDLEKPIRRAWGLISLGLFSYLLGDVLQFVYEVVLKSYPYPSLGDVCYLAFYPLCLAGILHFPRTRRTRSGLIRAALNSCSLIFGGAAVVWFVLLAPTALATGERPLQLVVSIAYPCGDLVLIFGLTTLLIGRSRLLEGRVIVLFASSLLLFVAADLIYGRLSLDHAYVGGDPVDSLWMVALALIAVCANEFWRATNAPVVVRAPIETEDSAFVPYLTIVVTFALVFQSLGPVSDLARGAVGFAAAATVLLLVRLRWSSIEKRRQGDYFQALAERVADYIVVLGPDLVARYASPSLLRFIGWPTGAPLDDQVMAHFVVEDDLPTLLASARRSAALPGSEIRAQVRIHGADGVVLNVIGVTKNLLDDPAVEGLVMVLHDITENARLEDELRHQALHDGLTGLPNRALIYDRITQMLAAGSGRDSAVVALFVDLDDFKNVNDSLGHAAGDELLQAVAGRLHGLVRAQDTVGRVGGDEFVVLTETTVRAGTVTLLAQRILDVMAEPFQLDSAPGRPLSMGASIGIAVSESDSPGDLLRDADLALYRAKASGKNRCAVFEPEMYTLATERLELELDLSEALTRDEFFLVYQPIINLETLKPVGVEALLRWQRPGCGVVGPNDFIPLLENRGHIIDVGRWVLDQACAQGGRWQTAGTPLSVSVNVSAVQLIDGDFVADVRRALAVSGLDPALLVIEITETVLMREPTYVVPVLEELKSLGLQIAIDDFGTGYSSLTYLRQFPIDVLKIDQSFVGGIEDSREAAAIVRTLIHLGSELGIDTVAEGIEEPGQLMALRGQSCQLGQGYWFARPMPAEAIDTFVAGWRNFGEDKELAPPMMTALAAGEIAAGPGS
jgi:diguanylate cyclase (GGDEF)-like protein/PAS domain S-box-containing protein